jgi:hypothetical protein
MRWGIVTAAVIAVERSLWLSLIVDRTISKHRGRPMRTRTVFSLALSLLPLPAAKRSPPKGASRSSSAIRATSTRLHSTIRSTTSRQ